MKTAIGALHDGQEYFLEKDENGEEVVQPCADTLIGAVEILYCTGHSEAVEELLAAVDKDEYRKVYCLVKGKFLEFKAEN